MRRDADRGTNPSGLHVLEVVGNSIVGGMERQVSALSSQLRARGITVTCLCPNESAFTRDMRALGCDVFVTPVRDDPAWRSIQMAVELIRLRGVSLLHAHMARAHVLAGLAGSLTRIPVVATIHGKDVSSQELGITRTLGSHLIVVCQEAFAQALALGVPPGRVSLIRNGVDTRIFAPGGSGSKFRAALDVPEEAPLVGFVGRLAYEKGPDQFIRLAAVVHGQRPDVHFALVGEGDQRQTVSALIGEHGLGEVVHLAGEWLDMGAVYPALDLVVQTSRSEGLSLSVLEAMASGLPVVATAVGGSAELVEAGITGRLAGAGDWEGAARAVVDLLARPERLREMGLAACERARAHFNLTTTGQLTAGLFERLSASGFQPAHPWEITLPAAGAASAEEPLPEAERHALGQLGG